MTSRNSTKQWFRQLQAIGLLGIALLVTGCAGYSPNDQFIGKGRTEVIALLGAPTGERPIAAGTLLEYARGPYGKHTYFITLNPSGSVVKWEQVLTEENFAKIKPGMSKQQVLSIIGTSFEVMGLARERGEVWSYRYATPFCIWYQIEFTKEGIIRSAGEGMPPECNIDSAP